MLQKEYLKSQPNIILQLYDKLKDRQCISCNPNIDLNTLLNYIRKQKDKRIFTIMGRKSSFPFNLSSRPDFIQKFNKECLEYLKHLNWNWINISMNMPLEELEKVDISCINWDIVSSRHDLTMDFVEKYKSYIKSRHIYDSPNISFEFLLKHFGYTNHLLLTNPNFTLSYVEKVKDNINIERLRMKDVLNRCPEDVYQLHYNLPINYQYVIMANSNDLKLVESLIDEEDENCWRFISLNPYLTTDFLKKYIDRPLNWSIIYRINCGHKELIEVDLDKPWYWESLSMKRDLDQNFISRNLDKHWDWYTILKHIDLNCDILLYIAKKYNNWRPFIEAIFAHPTTFYNLEKFDFLPKNFTYWSGLSQNPALTMDFIQNNMDNLNLNVLAINEFLYNPIFYRRSILKDIENRRNTIDIDICKDIKTYILKYYIGYD